MSPTPHRHPSTHSPLRLEPLEPRVLLSVTFTWPTDWLSGGPGKIATIAPSGEVTPLVPAVDNPFGLAYDQDGNLYYGVGSELTPDHLHIDLMKRAPDGTTENLGAVIDVAGSGWEWSFDLVVAASGLVYYTCPHCLDGGGSVGHIHEFNPVTGEDTVIIRDLANPAGLALDGNGNMYFTTGGKVGGGFNPDRDIYQANAEGGITHLGWIPNAAHQSSTDQSWNIDLAVGPDGYLYLTWPTDHETGELGSIAKVDVSTYECYEVVPGLPDPTGLAFDQAGNLYFGAGGASNKYILMRTPDGCVTNLGEVWSVGGVYTAWGFDLAGVPHDYMHVETLAREVAYEDWQTGDPVGAEFTVDRVFEDASGFYAIGLASQERGPMLVIRGTELTGDVNDVLADFDPRGVGFPQFEANRVPVEEWLLEMSVGGWVPSIVGHSLGGALAQWFAADYTSQGHQLNEIITFNSPGISRTYADRFCPELTCGVMHGVVSGDLVSMAGEAFIDGSYTLASFSDPLSLVNKHLRPILVESAAGLTRPPDVTLETHGSVDRLNDPLFMYFDRDYFVWLAAAEIATQVVPGLSGLSHIPPALMFRHTTEAARQDIGQWWDEIADSANVDIDANSAEVSVPRLNLTLCGLLRIGVKDLFLRYQSSPEESFRMQGSAELRGLFNAEANFAGQNYIEVREDDWDVVGTFSVGRVPIVPGVWEIKSAELWLDTVEGVVQGDATLVIPPGIDVSAELGFIGDELDYASLEFQSLNAPIGTTGAFLQTISGQVNHLAEGDPEPELSGSVGATYGPQLDVTLPSWAGGGFQGSLVRLDVGGTIGASHLVATGAVQLIGGVVSGSGSAEVNWDRGFLAVSQDFNALGGLVTGHGAFRATSDLNVTMTSTAAITIPRAIPLIGGHSVASGQSLLRYVHNGTKADDYVAAWSTFDLPLIGEWRGGYIVYLDGRYGRLGGDEIDELAHASQTPAPPGPMAAGDHGVAASAPVSAAFDVPAGLSFVLLGARWENSAADVPIRLHAPDGTVYDEGAIAASDWMAVVPDLSGPLHKTIVIADPQAGEWTLEVVDPVALGEVEFASLASSAAPTVEVTGVSRVLDDQHVLIEYEAFDADSDATISLFCDDDDQGFDGIPVVTTIVEADGEGAFLWDPGDLPSDEYHLYAIIVDEEHAPVFSDYVAASLGQTGADLVIEPMAPTTVSAAPGSVLTLNVNVANTGDEGALPAQAFDVTLFLSDDPAVDRSDTNVHGYSLTYLAPGGSLSHLLTFQVPQTPGTYTLAAVADQFDEVAELDEANNWSHVVTLVVEADGPAGALGYPTAWDQYLLEIINRARHDPLGEAALFGIDLNEGVPPEKTISPDPKQPVAMNLNLLYAAQHHTQWMMDNTIFGHTGDGGTQPWDRMANAGYVFGYPSSSGENIAYYSLKPDVPEMTYTTALLHEMLFVDEDYPDRGHRVNMLADTHKEVGAGVLDGPWDDFNAVTCTEDFAFTGTASFLTGVAYDDSLVFDDDFYTPGEALGSIAVTATRQSDGARFTTTTWTSGGYSLPLPPGTYDVAAWGDGLGGAVLETDLAIGSLNIKRDFTPDRVTASPCLVVTDDHGNPDDLDIDFGNLALGGGPGTATVTFTNVGSVGLDVTGILLSDETNYSVTWDGDGTPPTTIAAGATRIATIAFDPATHGAHDATFTVQTSEGNVVVDLAGTGIAPDIAVADNEGSTSDLAIDFGALGAVSGSRAHTVTIANEGNDTLSITGVALSDETNYTLTWDGDGGAPTTLAPAAPARTATITFDPTTVGTFDATLAIECDDPDEPTVVVTLTGDGSRVADRFEDNDTWQDATAFGPLPLVEEAGLTIEGHDDADWFRFTLPRAGDAQCQLEVLFAHSGGNIDARLYSDPAGAAIAEGTSLTDDESLPLIGLPAGTYYLEVYAADGTANGYDLVIQTSQLNYVGSIPGGGTSVVDVYDCDDTLDIALADIRVKPGKGNSIKSITLGGVQPMAGLGLVVVGADAVGSIKDARRGPLADFAFFAIDSAVKSVKLKGGLDGFGLNGLTLRDLVLGADLDGDGDTSDLTGLWTSGDAKKVDIAGAVDGETVVGGNVSLFRGRGAVNAGATVDGYLKKLIAAADFAGGLVVRGAGAPKTALGSAKIAGSATGGAWTITGAVGTIATGLDFCADLDAMSVKSMSVKRNLDGAAVTLTQAVHAKLKALGKLVVKGWTLDTAIASAGHVAKFQTGGMDGSTLFLDVIGAGLSDEALHFDSQCLLKSLTVKGIKDGKTYLDSFLDSNVAAWSIGKASIREVETDNAGDPFGFAWCKLGSLTWLDGRDKFKLPEKKPTDWPEDTGDFVAKELV